MAFVLSDRVRETSTAPGTGSFTVNGAVQGAQSFASVLTSNADTTWYAATNGTAWETGLLTRTSASVYARTTIFASSNAGAAVNFTSGPVDVFCDLPGSKAKALERLAWGAAAITPPTNDGTALGTGALAFSDLFLASGGVLNFNNGNYTVTHSAGLLTFSGAVTVTGAVTASSSLTMTSASPAFALNKSASGQQNLFWGYTNSSIRWLFMLGNEDLESGSNAGSNFRLLNYADNGTFIGTALTITRSNGATAFPQVSTTASAANAYLDNSNNNNLLRSTSSLRYKKDVEPLQDKFADAILDLNPIWYRSKAPADDPTHGFYGLAAEDVAKIDPRLVHWTYADDDYETIEIVDEVDVPETEEVDVPAIVIEGGIAVRKTVKETRQRFGLLPVFEDSAPSMVAGPDGKPVQEMISVPLTRKEKRPRYERKLRPGANKVPDGVQYERIAVLLLSVVKRMKAKR